jgi:endoglucanase
MVMGGLVGLSLAAGVEAAPTPGPTLLQETWQVYLRTSVRRSGRVVDARGGGHTTSEGQAYALLRAVWADDPDAFDRIYTWTFRRLQRGTPARAPAWKYGRARVLPRILDDASATDADLLMAWALQLAGERWERPDYLDRARALARTIWQDNVIVVGDRHVLLPGSWARDQPLVQLNPSYFVPFAMRDLRRLDPDLDWNRVIDDGYAVLADAAAEGQLLPDWLYLDPNTGMRVPSPQPEHNRHGFEAMRIPWMLAAEIAWYDEPRARTLLVPYLQWQERWATAHWLPAVAQPDGTPVVDYGHPALTGALLPAWALTDPHAAADLYTTDIAPTLGPDGWGDPNDYYAQNWIWFGIALWIGEAVPSEKTP